MAIDARQAELNSVDDPHQLLELLPTMAWTATPRGEIDFVNQECCAFTGLSREQLLAGGAAECVHVDDLDVMHRLMADLHGRAPFEHEFRARRHDGEYMRCVSRGAPMFGRNGQVIRWLGTTTVVEDMRRVADRLIQEEHLQLALDSADIGIWRLKLPEQQLTVDERTRRHLDLDRNVIENYRPEDLIHPDDFPISAAQIPEVNGRYVSEHRVRQRDGTYRWQAIHWRLYSQGEGPDAAPKLITGTSMDITRRKQAEAEQEELDQRYRIALAAAELGTWTFDIERNVVHLDDRARAHLNIDQPTSTIEQCLASIDEQDRQRTMNKARRHVRRSAGKNRTTIEFRVRHANGDVRWVATQVHVNFAPGSGRAVRTIGVTRDITKNKQAQEKVRRLNVDLERRVQQRTAELTAANEELESFAYAVSHDLRGPLRAMWGFSDAIIEDYGHALPPQAREYLQHVIDGSRHLGEIIDGLLTLSRSTRGALRRDHIDLSSIAEKVLRDLARVDPDRRVTWTIEAGLHAFGDSRMVDAVMRNLLGNAWKYTANRRDAEIRVYGERVADEYVFCVEDNGAGFNMEHAEKLFQPFQRLHRQDEFSGLGIGLATVQRIIHRHGGKVSGTGVLGRGAVFRFSMPLPEKSASHSK